MSNRSIEYLREVLEGARVLSVQPPTKNECIACLIVERGGVKSQFHIAATDLGWGVEHVRILSHHPPLYHWANEMFEDMVEHLLSIDVEFDDTYAIQETCQDDLIGFTCPRLGTEWWMQLSALIGQYPHMDTTESRAKALQWMNEMALAPPVHMVWCEKE